MAANSAIKIRLYPNRQQQKSIRQNCGCCRFVWNHFLARSIQYYELYEKPFNRYELQRELPALKLQYPWLKEANAQSLQVVLLNLDNAYKNFFRRVRNGDKPGFPQFKKKYLSRESFCVPQDMFLDPKTRTLRLPKLGSLNYRCDNKRWKGVKGISSVTVNIDAGKYYASCLIEVEDFKPISHTHQACGIDLGLKQPVTIVYESTNTNTIQARVLGKNFSDELRKKEQRRAHYQRRLARRQKGSNNHEKARRQVARAYQKERFCRQNWIEQTSHKLASNFEVIKFEALKISNMTRSAKGAGANSGKNASAKSGLNREMLRLGLSSLVLRTEQKSMTNGGQVVYIDPRYTSQTCSCCGVIDRKSRRSQSKFSCTSCGHTLNADTNAALNILRA